ncbi:MAG: hypothetical protein ABSA80_01145, partial [Terriglobales bacterium]
ATWSKGAENGFGAALRAVLVDRHTPSLPHQISIVAHGGLDVCAAGHGWFVMKEFGQFADAIRL